MISNLVGPKICQIGWLRPSAAEFLFPLTYICGDVFTEVYGYEASRRATWLGFFAMGQEAYATVFGRVPRFAATSLVAYWAGEITNSYALAKLKLLTGGRWLWTRTVESTVTGQAVDTAVVVAVAFAGTQPISMILRMILSSYLMKFSVEVVATPLTYFVVGRLKVAEGGDFFDRKTDFNPFVCSGRAPDQRRQPAGNMTSTAGEFFATMVRLPSSDGEDPPEAFFCPRPAAVASVTTRNRHRAVRSLPRPFIDSQEPGTS